MSKKLNPEIKEVEIGVRELRTIKIFPLSAKDQFDLTSRLVDVLSKMSEEFSTENVSNEEALIFIQTIISDNLEIILEYVVDEEQRPTFNELTNNQLYTIAETIFEVNYEGFLKNFQSLFKRAKSLIQAQTPNK